MLHVYRTSYKKPVYANMDAYSPKSQGLGIAPLVGAALITMATPIVQSLFTKAAGGPTSAEIAQGNTKAQIMADPLYVKYAAQGRINPAWMAGYGWQGGKNTVQTEAAYRVQMVSNEIQKALAEDSASGMTGDIGAFIGGGVIDPIVTGVSKALTAIQAGIPPEILKYAPYVVGLIVIGFLFSDKGVSAPQRISLPTARRMAKKEIKKRGYRQPL